MASYVMLFRYSPQGLEHLKQSPDRVDALKKVFEANGAKVKDFYFILGEYDTIFLAEAPSDEVIAKLALTISAQGNVRAETHRAFNEEEFRKILAGM
jgi:uncharacterized protein with GYD domain